MESTEKDSSPLLPKGSSQQESSRSFGQLVLQFIRGITVEPAYFIFAFTYGMGLISLKNLWVDKECSSLYSKDVCAALDSGMYPKEQDNIQDIVNTYMSTYAKWIEYLPAVFTVLILGAWSDTRDRKLPVVLPFVGYLLKAIGLIINSYFWSIPPQYLLLAYIPLGFGGSLVSILLGASSYLGAITTVRSRTVRISLIYILNIVAFPLGKYISAILFKHYGYISIFGCQAILLACGMIYTILRLEKHPGITASSTSHGAQTSLCKILSPVRMKETLLVPFKKREGCGRVQVLGHIIVIAGLIFDNGVNDFQYLYTRKKFGWDFFTFSTWSELTTPVAGIGSVLVMPVLSYRYHVDDSILGLMGTFSYMFSNIIQATAPAGWAMYLAMVSAMFTGMSFVASRGALSKLVPKEELGAIFAVVALGECIVPMLNGPFYTAVYNATLEIYPGTVFAITAFMFASLSCVYTWMLTQPDRPVFK